MKKKTSKRSTPALARVPLKFEFPNATSVRVSGSFNNWDQTGIALTPMTNGEWALELELAPGRHDYRLIVDDAWTDVPGAAETVENPFGSRNAVVVVGPPR